MKCDGCTLCCFLLPIPELNKKEGVLCSHCEENVGCKIHDNLPKSCLNFSCAYIQMKKVHVDLRPDNCKMIFEKLSDDLFFGTQDFRYKITDVAKQQIFRFNEEGYSVIINNNNVFTVYLAKNHTKKNILKEFNKIRNKLWQYQVTPQI